MSPSMTPAFFMHLENFPMISLNLQRSPFSFATFAFLISFYSLWTLFPNPPQQSLYLMLNASHMPLSYFWLLYFHLFTHIVDSLIAGTACQMTPGFILIYIWRLFISNAVLHFFPHFSPCAFTWPVWRSLEMHGAFMKWDSDNELHFQPQLHYLLPQK